MTQISQFTVPVRVHCLPLSPSRHSSALCLLGVADAIAQEKPFLSSGRVTREAAVIFSGRGDVNTVR